MHYLLNYLVLLLLVAPISAKPREIQLPGLPPVPLPEVNLPDVNLPNVNLPKLWGTAEAFPPLGGIPYGAGQATKAPLVHTTMYVHEVPDTTYTVRQWSDQGTISIYRISQELPLQPEGLPSLLAHISQTPFWYPCGTLPGNGVSVFRGKGELLLLQHSDSAWQATLFADPQSQIYDELITHLEQTAFEQSTSPNGNITVVHPTWELAHILSGYKLTVNVAPSGNIWFTWLPTLHSMDYLLHNGATILAQYMRDFTAKPFFTVTGIHTYADIRVIHAAVSQESQDYIQDNWSTDIGWVAAVQSPPLNTTWQDTQDSLGSWLFLPVGNILAALCMLCCWSHIYHFPISQRIQALALTKKYYALGLLYLSTMIFGLYLGLMLNRMLPVGGTFWYIGLVALLFNLGNIATLAAFLCCARIRTLGYQLTWQLLLLVPGINIIYIISLFFSENTPAQFEEGLPPKGTLNNKAEICDDVGDLGDISYD